jgi:Tetratricopeptide repeat
MADDAEPEPLRAPPSGRKSVRPHERPARAPDSESPRSSEFDGEDFLYHLYRGSELLQDDCVSEAKEELERALKLQPADSEGQGLLGVVYFRLGLYPRAIGIYEELIKARPSELGPRINLGLCYLKTGQSHLARDVLEDVLTRAPDHVRAWGYLGLAFERLGEPARAEAAFEKAKQPHLARRMRRLITPTDDAGAQPDDAERLEVRLAAADAVHELDAKEGGFSRPRPEEQSEPARVGRWRAVELGDASAEALPRRRSWPSLLDRLGPEPLGSDLNELRPDFASPHAPRAATPTRPAPASSEQLPFLLGLTFPEPPDQVAICEARFGALVTPTGLAARSELLSAVVRAGAPLAPTPLLRRARGAETSEPFGGLASAWQAYGGPARAVVVAGHERGLWALTLTDERLFLRESALAAFELCVRYENGRLAAGGREPIPMVQLSGSGFVVVETRGRVAALTVEHESPALVKLDDVLGWTGRLLGQAAPVEGLAGRRPSLVSFAGEGALLLDLTR